jgi:hypothetical protein
MISWLYHWLYEDFWCLIWPNAGAVPLCAAMGFLGAWLFRDRIGRRLAAWLHKHHTAHLQQLERDKPPGGPDAVR